MTQHPARRRAACAITTMAVLSAATAMLWSPLAGAADTPSTTDPVPAVSLVKTDRMAAGRAAILAKDWKKSIAELSVAVKDKPGDADAHNLLAYSYRKQARPDLPKAFEHYEMALKINPQHKGAHEYIGEAFLMDKKPAKAEEHLAQLKAICGNTTCEEYVDLAKSVAAYKAKNN